MKRYLFKGLELFLCIFFVINLCGCWSAKELNNLAIVMGIAIDKHLESDEVDVTVQLAKAEETKGSSKRSGSSSGSNDGGEGDNAYINLQNNGHTINDAMKGFNHMLSRRLFLSDNQVIIFGKNIAQEGIKEHLDFLLRFRETRMLVSVFVSEEEASGCLRGKGGYERLPSRKMGELSKVQEKLSQGIHIDLRKFTTRMMSKTTAPIAPILKISKDRNIDTITMFETAVFKKDKLIGKLNETETRGLAWGINEVKGGSIEISSPKEDKTVSIDITRAKGRIIPIINENEVSILIKIKQEGDIAEETATEDLVTPKAFEELQKATADKIRGEILSAVAKSKMLDADIFGFGDTIYKYYPKKWKEIEGDWDDILKKINVGIDVEAKLQRSGRLTKPIISEEE